MGGLEGDDISVSVPRRIMVVDDDPDSTETLAMLIGTEGHEVQTANDGKRALQLADAFKPELILMDISMPGLNGYEIARCLQERPWAHCLSLVAVSGWGEPADKQRAVAAGFSCYLVKPVKSSELMAVINGLPLPGGTD
jgi:CheY-like chemotaxis protein